MTGDLQKNFCLGIVPILVSHGKPAKCFKHWSHDVVVSRVHLRQVAQNVQKHLARLLLLLEQRRRKKQDVVIEVDWLRNHLQER